MDEPSMCAYGIAAESSLALMVAHRCGSTEMARWLQEAYGLDAIGAQTLMGMVVVYEVGNVNGQHYIAMEYVSGTSLRERLRSEKRLTEKESLTIAAQIASALEAAHGEGVIHRDI